jgi:hypothetical protein
MEEPRDQLSRRQKRDRAQFEGDLEEVLKTGHGRRVLRWVLERSGMFTSTHDPAYETGRRELGLEIVNAMNAVEPYAFVTLMKEGADEIAKLRSEARRKRNVEDDD